MKRLTWELLLALLLLSGTLAGADNPTILLADPPQGSLYLGPGRMLDAAPPRQLSLNAHIAQFLYQPGGLSIAYVNAQTGQDGGTSRSVRFVGLKRGETTTLFTRGDAPKGYFGVSLIGWTADARDLLVRSNEVVPSANQAESDNIRTTVSCIDVGVTPVQMRSLALTPPLSEHVPIADITPWWSPGRSRLLMEDTVYDVHFHETACFCTIYDPAQDKTNTFPLPPGESVRGWTDESHLLLVSYSETRFFSWDIAAETQTEIKRPAKMPETNYGSSDSADVSPKFSALSLDVEQRFHPDRQGVTGINSYLIWLRRAGQPKALSALPVGLTPGSDNPQAVWSPTGKQIAFLDHGDLFVTDLTERDATPKERYLAGEKLTCPEERSVATEALKQIGLAILQYTQDNDENYPALAGVMGNIRPYLPPNALLAVGGHPFVYHAPEKLSLAAMDDPAHTVLGTIDLPCAVVTLYADGRVKAVPKPQLGPEGETAL